MRSMFFMKDYANWEDIIPEGLDGEVFMLCINHQILPMRG